MSGFSISMWPGSPIPVPAVLVPASVTVMDREGEAGGPILVVNEPDENNECLLSDPPDELYLREIRDLDVGNPDAVAAFTQKYGRLGLPKWKEMPEVYTTELYEWDALADIDSRRWDYCQSLEGYGGDIDWDYAPLSEAALYVQLIRDMTRVWEYTTGMLSFSQVVEQWESRLWYRVGKDYSLVLRKLGKELVPYQEELLGEEHPIRGELPEEIVVEHPEEPADLYRFLDEFLGAALQAFHVRPLIYETEIRGGSRSPGKMISRSSPWVSLYGALCLQLANHIAEYRTCQKCGRLFYRQQGRARFGQHHTKGERLPQYCSWSCSHAAAQAQYKKRKIAAREQAEKDTTAIR
jgi:hypothetical protein